VSDYLSGLAARSLGLVAAIRPRLSSLYEPPPHGVVLPPEPVEPTAEAERLDAANVLPLQDRQPDSFQPAARVLAERFDVAFPPQTESGIAPEIVRPPPEAPAASVAPPQKVQESVDRTPRAPAVADATPTEPPRPFPTPFVALEIARDPASPPEEPAEVAPGLIRTERPEIVALSRMAARPRPPVEERALPSHRVEVAQAATTAEVGSVKPPVENSAPPRARQTGPEGRATAPGRAAPIPPAPKHQRPATAAREPLPEPPSNRITPTRIVVEPRLAPRAQPAPQAPPPQPKDQPAPDIHVTIGRVEVRAVSAAEPPARGRSAPPASFVSLDDYLYRRGERSKR
jgi:hypothetical protein